MAFPQLPASPIPFQVAEYFPSPSPSQFTDDRQHAVALAYVVPVTGTCDPRQDALELTWMTPEEAVLRRRRARDGGRSRRPRPRGARLRRPPVLSARRRPAVRDRLRAAPPLRSGTVLTTAAAAPTFTVSVASALTIAGAVLAVVDSALRFRRPGGNALLAILALVLGLLLLVRAFPPVQPYVSTSFPVLYLAIATTVVLLVELLVRSARKSGLLPADGDRCPRLRRRGRRGLPQGRLTRGSRGGRFRPDRATAAARIWADPDHVRRRQSSSNPGASCFSRRPRHCHSGQRPAHTPGVIGPASNSSRSR